MRQRRVPSYRRYKPRNLGLVVLDGHYDYLGRYGTPESVAEYHRLVQEWLTSHPNVPTTTAGKPDLTVDDVLVEFWRHAEGHYRAPDGTPTGELENLRFLRPVHNLYGHTPAKGFGPLALRAVRERMIADGLSRTTINSRVNRIRRVFRWGASLELIPPEVYQALQTVPGLQRGRSEAREAEMIRPVTVDRIEAILPHLPRAVAAMVKVQLCTGMRTGEVLIMRNVDGTVPECSRVGCNRWTLAAKSHDVVIWWAKSS